MSLATGYIALYRSILEWEWYSDINVRAVFIHCLLLANHKEKKWRGITIKRGQFISSRKELSAQIGITEQQFRTAIAKLVSTNEITSKGNAQHTVFTVINYDKYQSSNQQNNQQPTNDQPADNQPSTTTNNVNNENNEIDRPKKSATKTQLPRDFSLPDEWEVLAVNYWSSKNRIDLSAEEEFFKFKNHHLSQNSRSADWKSSWATWYAKAVQFNKPSFQVIAGQQNAQTPSFQNNSRQMPMAGSEK